MHTTILPTLNEFKSEAKRIKKAEGFQKLGHAQNLLAQKYGYKDFNAIRPTLIALENDNSNKSKPFSFDAGQNFDSEHHFDEGLPSEEIITMKELKKLIKESLEYSDPNDMFMMFSSHPLSLNMKPVVNDKFFDTEDEAVAYELGIDELYTNVKDCSDETKIVERFNADGDLLPYLIYEE